MTAITLAQENYVIVVGEDTCLQVLLLNHLNEQHSSNNIYFRSDRKKTGKEGVVHNIRNYRNVLGEDMFQYLLFLHSFTGCDTTSAFSGIGKGTHFLKMINSRPLQQLAKSFLLTAKTKVDVAQEGLKIIRILYNIRNDESLCQFRYRRLVEKIVKVHNFVKPERFPPTEDAAKFHSFRAYLQ